MSATFLMFCAAIAGAVCVFVFIRRLNESDYDKYIRMLGNSRADARRRGLSYEQWTEELAFRECYAIIRRIASDATLLDPANAHKIIKDTIDEECRKLAITNPQVAKRSRDVLKSAPTYEILYEDAYAAMMAHTKKELASRPTPSMSKQELEDKMAALKTLR